MLQLTLKLLFYEICGKQFESKFLHKMATMPRIQGVQGAPPLAAPRVGAAGGKRCFNEFPTISLCRLPG